MTIEQKPMQAWTCVPFLDASAEEQQQHVADNLEAAAYHESGHAVAFHLVSRSLSYVRIATSVAEVLESGRIGITVPCRHIPLWSDDLTVTFAGPAAEEHRTGLNPMFDLLSESQQDDLLCAQRLMGTDDRVRIADAYDIVAPLLSRRRIWKAIEALATLLMKQGQVDGDDAHEIIHHQIKREPKSLIPQVAAALAQFQSSV